MDRETIINFLNARGQKQTELHKKASEKRNEILSKNVYFRGLIEFSNICKNDCFYCGIRKSNNEIGRYLMPEQEILRCVEWCDKANYSSIVLQSGELQKKKFLDFLLGIVEDIKKRFPRLGITLSIGEQSKKTYEKLFEAGAYRYLLRIETSNKELYNKLHPKKMSFENRVKCISNLKEIGFQTGTGVMIGLPGQSVESLADDILFFQDMDIDMVGMGPYLCSLYAQLKESISVNDKLNFSLNMIAVLRLVMPDINIASTSALQAIKHDGRELGLNAGANVIMPLVTPKKYKAEYKLYDDKPCINESSDECLFCVTKRIKSVGLNPGFGKRGDSKHYFNKIKNGSTS